MTADIAGHQALLCMAERRLGLSETLAGCIREWRDTVLAVHTLQGLLRLACSHDGTRLADLDTMTPTRIDGNQNRRQYRETSESFRR